MEVDDDGVENGKAQLFDSGVLQLSWMMKNGKREGELIVYKDGVVDRVMRWDDLRKADKEGSDYLLQAIVNDVSGKELLEEIIVDSGIVVYRGEFDALSRKREGFGIEYDRESGLEKRSGYYKKGKLVQLCQEFKKRNGGKEMVMIEYQCEKDKNNANSSLDLCPVYVGDYAFDVKEFRFIRRGVGKLLNELSGICDRIGEWDVKGEKKMGSEIKLHAGWYKIGNDGKNKDQSIRISQLKKIDEDEKPYWNQQLSFCSGLKIYKPRGIEEFQIDSNLYNETSWGLLIMTMKVKLSDFKRLKQIEIGNDCFKYVREFVVDSLELLQSVKIGGKCFKTSDKERDDGVCRITNCPNLRQLEICDASFEDFKSFELSNLNSIQSIKFGEWCFQYADFSLKGE